MESAIPCSDRQCFIYGDSHVVLYQGLQGITTKHVGAKTLHRVGRDGLRPLLWDSHLFKPSSSFGFVFGEIDVRAHMARQCGECRREIFEIIGTLVEAYMRAIGDFAATTPHRQIAVFSSVPPAGMDYPSFDPTYPRLGEDADRAAWTVLLNLRLRRASHQNGFVFIDQYSMFAGEDGMLDLAVSDDGVHIKNGLAGRVDLGKLSILSRRETALNDAG